MGELAALTNAVVWALTGVVAKGFGRDVRPIHIVMSQSVGSVIVLTIVAAVFGQLDNVLRTPLSSAGIFAASAIINTLGSLMFWVAMSRGTVSRVYPTTQSIFILASMSAGWLFLGDTPRLGVIGGAVLIIAGVVLLNYQRRTAQQAADRRAGMIAIMLAVATSLMWAGGFVLTALGLRNAGPFEAAIIRNAVPMVLFGTLSYFVPWSRITRVYRKNWRRMTAGGFMFAAAGFTFVLALDSTSPGVVTALSNTSPMWAVAAAALILREKLTRQMLAGACMAVIGIFVVLAFR